MSPAVEVFSWLSLNYVVSSVTVLYFELYPHKSNFSYYSPPPRPFRPNTVGDLRCSTIPSLAPLQLGLRFINKNSTATYWYSSISTTWFRCCHFLFSESGKYAESWSNLSKLIDAPLCKPTLYPSSKELWVWFMLALAVDLELSFSPRLISLPERISNLKWIQINRNRPTDYMS